MAKTKTQAQKQQPVDDDWPKTPLGIVQKIEQMASDIETHAGDLATIFDGRGTACVIEELRDGQITTDIDTLLGEIKNLREVGYEKLCVVLQKAEDAEQYLEKIPAMFTDEDKQ